MKLATVNPELNFDIERILSKDVRHVVIKLLSSTHVRTHTCTYIDDIDQPNDESCCENCRFSIHKGVDHLFSDFAKEWLHHTLIWMDFNSAAYNRTSASAVSRIQRIFLKLQMCSSARCHRWSEVNPTPNFFIWKHVSPIFLSSFAYGIDLQVTSVWDNELQSVVQMGFVSNAPPDILDLHGRTLDFFGIFECYLKLQGIKLFWKSGWLSSHISISHLAEKKKMN